MEKEIKELEDFIEKNPTIDVWDKINSIIENQPSINIYMLAAKIKVKSEQYGDALNFLFEALKLDRDNEAVKSKISLIYSILNISNNFFYENTYLDDSLYE